MRPSASVARSRAASVEGGSLTSSVTGTAGWPVAPMRSLVSFMSSISPRTMRVRRSARSAAMAWPMPWRLGRQRNPSGGGSGVLFGGMWPALVRVRADRCLRGNRRLEHLFAPLAEAGRRRVLRGALYAVVQALVLGPGHVGVPLSHRIGHAEADEPVLVGLERDLLEAHVLAEHLRDDLGHVVVGQVLGSEQRDLTGTAPACVEQQPRRRGGDVAGGDGRPLAIARDRVGEHALVLDRFGLADRIFDEVG